MEKTGEKMTKSNQQHSDLYNYNLDHVYCSDNSNYRNTTHVNLSASAADLKALRKENKQLQAMLLLHLDLIQEQSNQLIAKDKQLLQMREENERLRLKCERNVIVERRSNNNKYGSNVTQKVLNTSGGSPTIDSFFTTIDSSQSHRTSYENEKTKFSNNITSQKTVSKNSILVEDHRPVINDIRHNVASNSYTIKHADTVTLFDDDKSNIASSVNQLKDRPKIVTASTNNNRNASSDKPMPIKYRTIESNIIGHNNGKLISKIILQRKQSENGEKIFVRTKNVDMSNNKPGGDSWSAVRMIKKEVIDNDSVKIPATSIALSKTSTASAVSSTMVSHSAEKSTRAPIYNNDQSLLADTSEPESPKPTSPIIDCQLKSTIKIENEVFEPYQKSSEDETLNESEPEESMAEPHEPPENMQCDASNEPDEQIEEKAMSSSSMSPTVALSTSSVTSPISIVNACDNEQSAQLSASCSNEIANSSTANINNTFSNSNAGTTILYPMSKRHMARNLYVTTTKEYKTREWQLDEIELELKQLITDEPIKDEENEANLETPKWRTWELSSNREAPVAREYEDLRDDVFARRHARFLLDERKRKKWDVQRIREQRTIERLKRRHCKDELNQLNNCNEILSFYPSADQMKTIQLTDELPVSAFGELIPLLPPVEFALPYDSDDATKSSKNNPTQSGSSSSYKKSDGPGELTCSSPTAISSSAQTVPPIRISNVCHTGFEAPATVSSIIFLTKKRAPRTKQLPSSNATQPHASWKNAT